jgi:hypothetical protein
MKTPKRFQNNYLLCSCKNKEHKVLFFYNVYNPGVYMQVHLVRKPLLQRLVYAIKYVFGYRSKHGAFDEFVFHPDHSKQLLEVIDHLTDEHLHSFYVQ